VVLTLVVVPYKHSTPKVAVIACMNLTIAVIVFLTTSEIHAQIHQDQYSHNAFYHCKRYTWRLL